MTAKTDKTTPPDRGFSQKELAARCTAAQAAMAQRGVDVMLFASEPEIRYFTGFLTPFWQSPTRPWFLLLPLKGKPVAVIPTIGAALMRDCHVGEIVSWPSPAPGDDGISLLVETVHGMTGGGGDSGSKAASGARAGVNIGILMGRETSLRMPAGDFLELRNRLPDAQWHDMTADIQKIRMVKSPGEIARIRHACDAATMAFDALASWQVVGMPLAELFRRFKCAALEAGVDDVSYLVGAAGPDGYQDIIAPPGDRPIARGDILMLDTGCVREGYFCDFDRNFAIGRVSEAAMDAHRRLYDATDAALDALRPGITASDLFHAMDAVLRPGPDGKAGGSNRQDPSAATSRARAEAKAEGTGDVGRYGHGLGSQLTETPSHAAWDTTPIVADMVLTLEPSITYTGADGGERMMVAEENLVVTSKGHELLTRRVPREIVVIGE